MAVVKMKPPKQHPNNRRIREATRREFEKLWSEWKIREKRKPSRWASEVRIMPVGGPVSGDQACKYDHAFAPHAIEIMDAADDPSVRVIVNWSAVRDSKTAICLNVLGRTVTDSPGGIYDVHPIDDDVSKFSNDDVEPMIEACLSDYFVGKKSRDSGRTINYKKFRGGSLRIVNAGSLTKFRGSTVRVLFLHEVDGYTDKKAIHKAINRAKGISDAIIFLESTGTYAPTIADDGTITYNSSIHEWHDKGDKRKWFCKCRKCGARQWLKFKQIQARDGDERHAEYFCERCDAAHNEAQWRKMAASGIWYPTAGLTEGDIAEIEVSHKDAKAEQREVRSYWRNGFNSLLPKHDAYETKLHEFLAEGEAAKTSTAALEIWTNEIAAELWNIDAEKTPPPAYQPILDNREDYATAERVLLPMRALVLTCATDLHGDRLEIEWRAWARNEESWGAGHFVLFGDTNRTEVWDEWTKHLQRTFPHESGASLKLSLALVDGGWRTDPIVATLKRLALVNVPGVSGKIRISKGAPKWQSVIHDKWGSVNKKVKGIIIGTWCAKAMIYERLEWHSAKEKPSASFIHFGKSYSDEFIRQIVSESPVWKIIDGKNILTFKNPEGNRNEGIDLIVGNLAAFHRQKDFGGWDFDTIEKTIAEEAALAKGVRVPSPVQKIAATVYSGRGWKL